MVVYGSLPTLQVFPCPVLRYLLSRVLFSLYSNDFFLVWGNFFLSILILCVVMGASVSRVRNVFSGAVNVYSYYSVNVIHLCVSLVRASSLCLPFSHVFKGVSFCSPLRVVEYIRWLRRGVFGVALQRPYYPRPSVSF